MDLHLAQKTIKWNYIAFIDRTDLCSYSNSARQLLLEPDPMSLISLMI